MYPGILTALAAGGILLTFAALPPLLPGSTPLSLSGSAQAATTIKSSKSNSCDKAATGTTPSKGPKSNSCDDAAAVGTTASKKPGGTQPPTKPASKSHDPFDGIKF